MSGGDRRHVVWLAGMPRSGTTWLAQILNSNPDVRLKHDPLFSYEFKNRLNFDSTLQEWNDLFDAVYERRGEFLDQDYLRSEGHVPKFEVKRKRPSHLVIKSNRHHDLVAHAVEIGVRANFLFLVRDPVETIASWIGNPTEFPAGACAEEQWRTGSVRKVGSGEFWGFDDWLTVTERQQRLAERHPDRVRLQRYEDLVSAPRSELLRLFQWLELDFSPQTQEFLVESSTRHSDHPRSVFKDPARRRKHADLLPSGARETMINDASARGLGRFLCGVKT